VGNYFGVSIQDQINAMSSYDPDNNRSQIVVTAKNTLIMDAYNANPSSMEHALVNLSRQKGDTFFVMGDMRELGDEAPAEHEAMLRKAQELGLTGVTVGEVYLSIPGYSEFKRFATNVEAKEALASMQLQQHTILIKGSRGIRLEEIKEIF
jgi:UDP-N-acetylmuramoyl-tripeptide--D-alanyl-D-alanine ligase